MEVQDEKTFLPLFPPPLGSQTEHLLCRAWIQRQSPAGPHSVAHPDSGHDPHSRDRWRSFAYRSLASPSCHRFCRSVPCRCQTPGTPFSASAAALSAAPWAPSLGPGHERLHPKQQEHHWKNNRNLTLTDVLEACPFANHEVVLPCERIHLPFADAGPGPSCGHRSVTESFSSASSSRWVAHVPTHPPG